MKLSARTARNRSLPASCVVACLVVAGCSSIGSRAGGQPATGASLTGAPVTGASGRAPHQSADVTSPVLPGAPRSSVQPSAAPSRSGSGGVADPTGVSTPSTVGNAKPGCRPRALQIPSVGIEESVRSLGLNAQGQIYPPQHTTMWYTGSAVPGQDGIAVVAGHVTYEGPDNFYNLVKISTGASVNLQCATGGPLRLSVVRTASVPKTKLQTDQTVWGSSTSPVVVLITCDPNSRMVNGHHLNNFVAWTTPT